MAEPAELSPSLIKIFVESGLAEIRRIEDAALAELKLRYNWEKIIHKQRSSPPGEVNKPTEALGGLQEKMDSKEENSLSSGAIEPTEALGELRLGSPRKKREKMDKLESSPTGSKDENGCGRPTPEE